ATKRLPPGDDPDARRRLDAVDAVVERANERILARAARPAPSGSLASGHPPTVDLDVTVRPDARVELVVDHGAVGVEHVDGPIHVESGTGPVELGALGGGVTVRHQHGDVTLDEVTGSTDVRVATGAVSLA